LVGMIEVESGVCPYCDDRISDFGVMEVEEIVTGDQSRTVNGVVCPSCERLIGFYGDYQRSDIVEGSAEDWERVRGVDEQGR